MLANARNAFRKHAPPELTASAYQHTAKVKSDLAAVSALPSYELKRDTLQSIKADIDSSRASVKTKGYQETYKQKHEEKQSYSAAVNTLAQDHTPALDALLTRGRQRLNSDDLNTVKKHASEIKQLGFEPAKSTFYDAPIATAQARFDTAHDFGKVSAQAIRTGNPHLPVNRTHEHFLSFLDEDGAIPHDAKSERIGNLTTTYLHSAHSQVMHEADAAVRAFESLVASNKRASASYATKQIAKLQAAEDALPASTEKSSLAQKLTARVDAAKGSIRSNKAALDTQKQKLLDHGFSREALSALESREASFNRHINPEPAATNEA